MSYLTYDGSTFERFQRVEPDETAVLAEHDGDLIAVLGAKRITNDVRDSTDSASLHPFVLVLADGTNLRCSTTA